MQSHSQKTCHSRPGLDQGLRLRDKPLGAESGPKAKAKFLGAKPRSGPGP